MRSAVLGVALAALGGCGDDGGPVVGALTVGKAAPYLWAIVPTAAFGLVAGTSSVAALLAAALIWVGYEDGPHAFPARAIQLRPQPSFLLGGQLLDPIKTTVVHRQRAMSTWVVPRSVWVGGYTTRCSCVSPS